jgi:hypothetical protein
MSSRLAISMAYDGINPISSMITPGSMCAKQGTTPCLCSAMDQLRSYMAKRESGDSTAVSQLIDAVEGAVAAAPPASAAAPQELLLLQTILGSRWELQYSSLIPSGWFPIREVVDFRPNFELISSWGGLPLGTIQGTASASASTSAPTSTLKPDGPSPVSTRKTFESPDLNPSSMQAAEFTASSGVVVVEFFAETWKFGPLCIPLTLLSRKPKTKTYTFFAAQTGGSSTTTTTGTDKCTVALARSSSGGGTVLSSVPFSL